MTDVHLNPTFFEVILTLIDDDLTEPPEPTSDDYADAADRFELALYGETRRGN